MRYVFKRDLSDRLPLPSAPPPPATTYSDDGSEHEVVHEIGKIVVLNANDWFFSTSVFARGDLESLA